MNEVTRVLWASNVRSHGLLERAESVAPGRYASMSIFTADAVQWEQDGGTLAGLRREVEARGGPISAIDPYLGWYPGYDASAITGEAAALLQATEDDVLRYASELGAVHLTLVAPFWGPDAALEEVAESLGAFADRARAYGVRPHLEPIPSSKVHDVAAGVALVGAVGRENLGLLLDTYNMSRAGTAPEELDAVPHDRIFQIQVADSTQHQRGADYFEDSLHYRELPGDGELPVVAMLTRLAALGPLAPVGPEVFSAGLDALPATEAALAAAEATERTIAAATAAATA